ncbi:Uncharacterised protein [Legionella busanensis]|uniref:Peptidase S26 domain-containing protein n=1 Tax=Legionella busanensis TaxID=190655 RepID=A0A378KD94_9GAMM|nr:hypothetical protein [Legionella busanensis]STX81595.1 Uncharacterised protein [Legionella busanensis]
MIKQRGKWFSFLLALTALAFPGLGQIFAGRIKRALFFSLTGMSLGLLYWVSVMDYIHVVIPLYVYACMIIFSLYSFYDVYKLNSSKNGVRLYWYNKWYFYLFFAILFFIMSNFNFITGAQSFRIMNDKFYPTLAAGDKVVAKMNYKSNLSWYNPSNSNYRTGSFIFLKEKDSGRMILGKIIAVGKNIFKDDKQIIFVPQDTLLVAYQKKEYALIPTSYVQGQALWILWSKNISKIGLRIN